MGSQTFVEVAFPIPLNKTFHYQISDSTLPEIPEGTRVRAPFGKKHLIGYAVATTAEKPHFPTKPISEWLDMEPLLDASLLELAQWLSKTYLCSLGEALACILPPRLAAPKRPRSSELRAPSSETQSGPELKLSAEQQIALDQFFSALDRKAFEAFLLRGITDSGKTELYLRAIDHALKQDRQALFLLPEIALTPPFIEHLKARYSESKVGLWHSGISDGERYRTWQRVRRGETQVLLGARSAVFAPFPRLGLIVMDEEHEPSYKQEDRPRYHTREVALRRAENSGALLIMGSATPSMESYWKARQGIYRLVELTSRVEMRQLPPVILIDRRTPPQKEGKRIRQPFFAVFSEALKLAIEQRLARREQVLLFVNRRGFTPFLRCSKCGWVARCPRCSLAMALHLGGEVGQFLQCHGCLHKEQVIIQCPGCKSMRLRSFGIGTQRVEQEVKKLFPFVKLARLDRDISQFRRSYEKIYHAFANKELDMLVGTQIIAKGFDFPGVTLVGVVDADVSLHLPDFRSAERTFQLITQVAGRTGRGERGGKVLVQTHYPDHPSLQSAQQHDFVGFYEQELPHREALNYPPFCELVNLLVRGAKEDNVRASSDELAEKLARLGGGVEVLGPAPSPYNKLRGQFRYQIVLKGSRPALRACLDFLRTHRLSKAYLTVDVDPVDLL